MRAGNGQHIHPWLYFDHSQAAVQADPFPSRLLAKLVQAELNSNLKPAEVAVAAGVAVQLQ